jgi:glycosyltransferase involved in cell wall biosynthesis
MSLEPPPVSPPSISVVLAVRNGAATLQRALDSVFEQTHPAVELIVMDAASTDGTVEILERSTARIDYWESKSDRGIYHAWNKALDRATGDWICFLGADDRYHAPGALAAVAEALALDTEGHRVAYGGLEKVWPDGRIYHARGSQWDPRRRRRFRRGVMIPHPATFHHRTLFELHGRFDESFRIAGDYEFLLRELLDHDPLYIPEVVVDMAAGGLSDRP